MKTMMIVVLALAAGAVAAGGGLLVWQSHNGAVVEQGRDMVKAKLTDPDSAVFRSEVSFHDGIWCGEVNARNRMGGMVGFTRFIVYATKELKAANLTSVEFESSDPSPQSFQIGWTGLCEPDAKPVTASPPASE